MKHQTDDVTADAAVADDEVTQAPPRIEDILSTGNWEDRLAEARARREKVLAGKPDKPKKRKAARGAKSKNNSAGIDDILATANWSDRLALAKQHRDQVLAKRELSKGDTDKPVATGPVSGAALSLSKDTVRSAVSGVPFKHQPSKFETKRKEKKTTAAVVFPTILPPETAVLPPETEQKKRYRYAPIAAGFVLAIGIGMFLPNPFRSDEVVVTVAPVVPEAVAVKPVTEAPIEVAVLPVEAVPETAIAMALLPSPEITDVIEGLSAGFSAGLPVVNRDAIVLNAPIVEAGAAVRVAALRAPLQSRVEPTPKILSAPYDGPLPVTVAEVANPAIAPVLELAPEMLLSIAAPTNPAITPTLAMYRVATADHLRRAAARLSLSAPVVPTGVLLSGGALVATSLRAGGSLDGFADLTASLNASLTDFSVPETGPAGVLTLALSRESDPDIEPTHIVFLSGPTALERPVVTPLPLAPLTIAPEPARFELPAAADVLMPAVGALAEVIGKPVRLASLGAIPVSALPAEPKVLPQQPEAFETMAARLAIIAPEVTAEKTGFPGAEAFTIHLRASITLPKKKLGAFATALQETGFIIEDPKQVNFTIRKNNVRYFHESDAAAARILADAVNAKARDFTGYRPSPPVGSIEVWLAGETAVATSRRPVRRPSASSALNALRSRLLKSLQRGDHL
ncbi:MAG: hypothetical protein ACU0CA_10740 [Paracoccaceae bacterium]